MSARTFTFNVVAPPSGVPVYAQGMADFEVRHLSGAYAPTNGVTTLQAAQPLEFRSVDAPSGLKGIINAWSGGREYRANRILMFSGGGHSVSVNNGLMLYDFKEDAQGKPVGWSIAANSQCTLAEGSASSTVSTIVTTSKGNMPTSDHTYDGACFDPVRRRYWRPSGMTANSVTSPQSMWYYDFNDSRWHDHGFEAAGNNNLLASWTPGFTPTGSTCVPAPDGAWICYVTAYSANPFFLNTTTAQIVTASVTGSLWGGSQEAQPVVVEDTGASRANADPNIRRYFTVADNMTGTKWFKILTINWTTRAITVTNVTPSSTVDFSRGGSLIFDELLDCFWYFGGRIEHRADNVNFVLRIDADTFAVSKHTFINSGKLPVADVGNTQGTYNRHVWIPSARLVGTCTSYLSAPSVIKLPSA